MVIFLFFHFYLLNAILSSVYQKDKFRFFDIDIARPPANIIVTQY